jgi:ribosomal protein S18 acetylase RimI-like enzyme
VPPLLAPLSADPEASRRFGLRAIRARELGDRPAADWVQLFEEQLASGRVTGRLLVVDGRPRGLATWSPGGPPGLSVHLLYAAAEGSDPAEYGRLLAAVEGEVGPVAFVTGPLAGLSDEVEESLMRSRGFRRFSRSEMRLDPHVPLAEPTLVPGERVRPAGPSDLPELAELHRRAYHARFDRYLFQEEPDERADALRGVREILEGRWGSLDPAGSWLLEQAGRPLGAVLSVRSPAGRLIADVVVDPEHHGSGIGRRVLTRALAALRQAEDSPVYLNVTEGNERALRLYGSLGFVRSLGPSRGWYRADRVPVAPSADG